MRVDTRTEELLGLHEIRRRLVERCQSAQGRSRALGLAVADAPEAVAERQAETIEAIELRRLGVAISAGAVDVDDQVANAVRGGTLELESVVQVAICASVCAELAQTLASHGDAAPRLADLGRGITHPRLQAVADLVDAAHDGHGGLRDSASVELGRARRQLAEARSAASQALRDAAQRFKSHLQEGFLTERGGRPVLAVKASAKSAVKGIVHDRSATGNTIFIEPLEVVDASNRVREMEAVERMEVERVLARLSAAIAEDGGAITTASGILAHVDLAFAMADQATRWGGCTVTPSEDVELVAARHPLLDPASVVPIDLPLSGRRGLVVSGPNAGGKTVALKTLGLLALCHQLGLQPPAKAARLPVFDMIFADIGDEQSIEQSLSTFSGHMRKLIAILDAVGPRSLVLLDEIAAGTDPAAGAALARAIVQALIDRGALVLVTTHFDELKGWASLDRRVANAAVGFDAERLAPTFTIRVGEPGASHAIEVAQRLGLDPRIVATAHEVLGGAREGVEALLQDAAAARVNAEQARDEAIAERDEVTRVLGDIERREEELARQIERRRADASAARERARQEATAELGDLQRELATLRRQISAARKEERRRANATQASQHEAERDRHLGEAAAAAARAVSRLGTSQELTPNDELAVGDPVLVHDLGVRGTIIAIDGDSVIVQGPLARLTLKRARLTRDRLVERPNTAPPPPVERRPAARSVGHEIDVRGERAEAACALVRDYIDTVAMSGLETVRVIHGRGTGALRAAIGEELRRHPMVAQTAVAAPNEGGDGATVVTLR